MPEWTPHETSTHQDHVIAHVVGATPLAYFIFDETVYFLLDIGFIWHIYLDGEMGLVPHPVATTELAADESVKIALKQDVDAVLLNTGQQLRLLVPVTSASPIHSVELLRRDDSGRVVLTCERGRIIVETSLESGEVSVMAKDDPDSFETSGLSESVREESEFVRERVREELGREPSQEEMDEWLRNQTEGY